MTDANLLVGFTTGDDAAVYRLREDLAIVQTVDFFPPIVDDPYHFGAISAANSISDVYAMGGTPLLALNIVGFPVELPREILGRVLKGAADKAQEAGVVIVGGHTIDDEEPKFGMAVTGIIRPGDQITNAGAQPGDVLILTKPIGTGVITTAGKQGVVDKAVLDRAVAVMGALNHAASDAMVEVGVNACTDVTGFGLVGHLQAMVDASGVGAMLSLGSVPVIHGVWELIRKGIAPGGTHRNLTAAQGRVDWSREISDEAKILLCDAQTSGGLLMAVPPGKSDRLLSEMHRAGVSPAAIVGEVVEGPRRIRVAP